MTDPVGKAILQTSRFAGVQFFFWASIVAFEAFMVPFLTGNGYSPSQAGFVMSAIFGLAILGQPLLGSLSDRLSSPKWIAVGAMLIAGAGALFLPSVVDHFAAVVGVVLLYSLTANSIPAVLDAWIMASRRGGSGASYGVARGFGSLGFAVGAVVIGALADRYGIATVFRVYAVVAATTAGLSVLAPPAAAPPVAAPPATPPPVGGNAVVQGDAPSSRGFSAGIAAALGNRAYLLLLAASFLAFVGFRAGITFLPLALESVGGSISDVGTAHSLAALSEVPFMFFSGLVIRRVRGTRLITLVLILMSIRLFTYSVAASALAILLIQLSHGLTFGLFLAAVVHYIDVIAPAEHRGLFQAIAPSVFFGLGSVVGSWTGGFIVELLSVAWLFRLSAVTTLLGAALLPVLGRRAAATA